MAHQDEKITFNRRLAWDAYTSKDSAMVGANITIHEEAVARRHELWQTHIMVRGDEARRQIGGLMLAYSWLAHGVRNKSIVII
jgi:hypothetical protein